MWYNLPIDLIFGVLISITIRYKPYNLMSTGIPNLLHFYISVYHFGFSHFLTSLVWHGVHPDSNPTPPRQQAGMLLFTLMPPIGLATSFEIWIYLNRKVKPSSWFSCTVACTGFCKVKRTWKILNPSLTKIEGVTF